MTIITPMTADAVRLLHLGAPSGRFIIQVARMEAPEYQAAALLVVNGLARFVEGDGNEGRERLTYELLPAAMEWLSKAGDAGVGR